MSRKGYRIGVLVTVAALTAVVVVAKNQRRQAQHKPQAAPAATAASLPKVLDFGRGLCIPCKMMAPILKELQGAYEGRAVIQIIDIGDQPDMADQYDIQAIPTQIFIDAKGKEVFRHEGFMPKEDIVAKLKEMGVK